MDRVGQEFAGHRTLFKASGTEAGQDVQTLETGDLADDRAMLARERHPAVPGACDGMLAQERKEFDSVLAVDCNAGGINHGLDSDLAIATDDDLATGRLASVEMPGETLIPAMREFVRR